MYLERQTRHDEEVRPYLPLELDFLSQNDAAFAIIEKFRWVDGRHCPRCKSVYTKIVNTSVFRELIRCVDCGYLFNKLSRTMFQGAKIPLYKFFQLFVLYDAIGRHLSPRDVSYALDVSHKTALALLNRLSDLDRRGNFTLQDRPTFEDLKSRLAPMPPSDSSAKFFTYCDSKNISVNMPEFEAYIEYILIEK